MKPAIATIFIVIIAWLLLMIWVFPAHGQTVAINSNTRPVMDGERAVLLRGRVAGDWKTWLTVEAHNGYQWKENGYDPSLTRVISDYKPIFRKLPNGQWEIGFVSEIAEKLP